MRYAEGMATSTARPKGDQPSLFDSFRRLGAWLREHDALPLMKSLSPGTKPMYLAKLEQKLGFTVPPGLRALWLMHDGQRRADECLVEHLHLLPVAWVLNERPATLKQVARARSETVGGDLTEAERQSDAWLPVATRWPDCVLVNATTGRVFTGGEGTPALQLVARSVPEWLEAYVTDVERGVYELRFDSEGAHFARIPD
jgi:cell wall assembly regulator SMI1